MAASPLAGDYNNDGVVDAIDYAVWRENLGAPAGTLENGDEIGAAHFATWRVNYGASGAGSAGQGA